MNRNPSLSTQHNTQPPARRMYTGKGTFFDVKTLKDQDATMVVQRLNEGMNHLKFLLRSKEEQHNSDEFILNLTCTLAKACRTSQGENTNKILAAIKGSVFVKSKIPHLLDHAHASTALSDQESRRSFINCLIIVFMKYLTVLPSSYTDLPYAQLKLALDQSNIDRKEELQKELDAFKQARDDIIKAERQKHGKRYTNRAGEKPPNDFRDIPICPTNKEITTQERPFLRKNISKGRYENAEQYLDIQFRLLREDFLEPLREGIHEIVQNVPRQQRKQFMRNYHSVRILSKEFTRSGIIHQVKIDVSRFDTSKWAQSKRLMFGSFLCLSDDNFNTMLFATVSERDPEQLKQGIINIRFIEEQDVFGIESRNCVYQMVESPAYFEAYRHVLKGLKELDETTLPFKKYLLECSGEVDPPEYLRRDDTHEEPVCYDLRKALGVRDASNASAVPVLQADAWPSVKKLPLNSSQLDALRTAITTEFSVIQGPPGTGKTYVGAKIVRCLLQNRVAWDRCRVSPMLMVCYTNHALDQFLEKVLEFLPSQKIIRVGGRSKSENLAACNLKRFTYRHRLHEKRDEVDDKITQNNREMKKWKGHLAKADKQLLEFDDLEELLPSAHADQLCNAIFPSNVANECRTPSNTFKLWLCNNELVNSRNKTTNAKPENQTERAPDGSILEQSGTNGAEEVSSDATLSIRSQDTDENNTNEPPKYATRVSVDVSNEVTTTSLQQKDDFSEQQELKKNATDNTLPRCSLVEQSSILLGNQLSSNVTRASLDVESELEVTPLGIVGIVEEADGVKEPNGLRAEKHHSGHTGKKVDEKSEGDDETIEIEMEADLIQHRRCIEGDEDLLLAISEETNDLASQEQDQAATNEEPVDEWTTVTFRKKGTPFFWKQTEGENFKEESKDTQVSAAENEGEMTETKPLKKKKKKKKNKNVSPTIEIERGPDIMHQLYIQEEDILAISEEINDDVWTTVTHSKKGTPLFWEQREGENYKEEGKGAEGYFEGKMTETKSPKKKKKKKKKKKNKIPQINITGDIAPLREEIGKQEMMSTDEAMGVVNIWSLSQSDRLRLYLFWIENYRERYRVEIQRSEQEYQQLCQELEDIRFEEEEQVMRQATVVGMTTSGAARYHSILQRISPKIVVIEEAAEVMEAHIITSLSRDTKHTILIGDHKQLRPKATVYELAQTYNLEVSLFERMVINSMDCKRLSIQHRMRPEIAALTKRIYDHEIMDHYSVCHFKDISGVRHNLFFIDHCHPENLVGGLQSYSNPHEAAFLVALCNYLLLQGYDRDQITVLTMYTGQLLLLQEMMPRRKFGGVRVCAVDNFQGEENDIILLSLVRSNSEGRIGFLGESNRICVALSRARKGFYCIGNFNLLNSQCKLWREICEDLKTKEAIGDSLQLVCKRHHNVTSVRRSSEFNTFGGCTMACADRLDCGHACERPCHASDLFHEDGHCSKMCINSCPNNHHCPRKCHYPQDCFKCYERVLKILPRCGHEQPVACSNDPDNVSCAFKCDKTLKCGHNCQKLCGKLCTNDCTVNCTKTLPCGHEKSMPCYKDPMVHNQCNKKCDKLLDCGHPCSKRCTEPCQCNTEIEVQLPCEHRIRVLCRWKNYPIQCIQRCKRALNCGHDCPGICHEDCRMRQCHIDVSKVLPCGHQQIIPCYQEPKTAFCYTPCPRVLNCGHKCSSVCGRFCEEVQCEQLCQTKCERGHPCQKRCHFGSSCGNCMVVITMTIPTCGHIINMPCYVDPTSVKCKQPCERARACGHPCKEICSKNCEARPCKVLVPRTLSCHHVVTLACHKNPEKFICKERVEAHLSCGHKTTLECNALKAGLENVKCKEKVEKELRCEHKLTLPCHKNPEECTCRKEVKVELPCGHMKSVSCSTKTAGLPNVSCTAKVRRTLPCGHDVTLPCHRIPEEYCCQEEVEMTLPCGHKKLATCFSIQDGLQDGVCDVNVTRKLPCGHEKATQCSDKPGVVFCDAPCERVLGCGHPCSNKCGVDCASFKCAVGVKKNLSCGYHNISCLCTDDVSQLICSNRCQRKLACGHQCPGKCSDECTQYVCQTMVVKNLHCAGNHSLKMPCKDDPNSVACQERCNRYLDCGHPCPGLCSEPCESMKCIRRVEKIYPCGHEEKLQCFQSKAAICMAPCQRREKCKHKCKGVCGEPCSKHPCDVAVGKTLSCGHKIMMPCSYPVDEVQCPAPCGATLPCGHQCSGTCNDCHQRGSHEMCRHPCSRLLICSHRCIATCSEPCPPCARKCGRRCPHGKCTRRCWLPCEPCKQRCKWNCPHYQCNNLCGEECDRPPCDAPCPKKLSCRHRCIGLCGENCPTKCAICHAKQLSSMLGGRCTATESTRYLQLFDCGHILKVEDMDAWMHRELGSDVQVIQCPRCSTVITFSYRYGNLIKRKLRNTESVKIQIQELANEASAFTRGLLRDSRHLTSYLRQMKFPQDVLSTAEIYKLMAVENVNGRNIPLICTLKNHLLVVCLVDKAQHSLQNVVKHESSSNEQLEIKEHSSTIQNALRTILVYLMKPQLDLRTLNQVQEHTRKFALFVSILEAQCEAIKSQRALSSMGETRLKLARNGFNSFVQGNNDALQIDWLETIAASLRKEVGLASLPPEEPEDFENFPGFSRGVWKLCEHHRVYFKRSIMCDGEEVNVVSNCCGRCVDMEDSDGREQ